MKTITNNFKWKVINCLNVWQKRKMYQAVKRYHIKDIVDTMFFMADDLSSDDSVREAMSNTWNCTNTEDMDVIRYNSGDLEVYVKENKYPLAIIKPVK